MAEQTAVIHVRLFGELARFAGGRYAFDRPWRAGQTVAGILSELGVPDAEVWMVAINGRRTEATATPRPGDEVMAFSPVTGG